jgi:hypothetical protein
MYAHEASHTYAGKSTHIYAARVAIPAFLRLDVSAVHILLEVAVVVLHIVFSAVMCGVVWHNSGDAPREPLSLAKFMVPPSKHSVADFQRVNYEIFQPIIILATPHHGCTIFFFNRPTWTFTCVMA